MVTQEKLMELKDVLMTVCNEIDASMTKVISAVDALIAEAPPETKNIKSKKS